MKYLAFQFLIVVALLLPTYSAEASIALDRAKMAFDEGKFQEAAKLARRASSPDGYAFAARAGLVYADFLAPPKERLEIVRRAEEDARRAIALAPELAEGRLQLAIALGFRGRLEGYLTAHIDGLANEARTHLDYVVAREPDNPWVHALLGGWHLEIVQAGGLLGRTLYGAGVEAGIAEYAHALTLVPGELVVTFQCALQLTALGDGEYRRQAVALLGKLDVPATPTALQMLTLARARRLQTVLNGGTEAEIDRVVQAQKGGNTEEASLIPRQRHQIRPPIGLPR